MDPRASSPGPPTGWPVSADGIAYPPEPWRLRGELYGSFWLVPRSTVEAFLPEGVAPLAVSDRALVVTGWAVYRPGSVLRYRELLCGVALRADDGFGLSITHIWVDDPASMAGGRELWGVPKQLARFAPTGSGAFGEEARDEGGQIARLTFDRTLPVPGQWPLTLQAVQELRGRLKVTRLRIDGRVDLGRAVWRFSETGPLGFLRGHMPILSVRSGSAVIGFGVDASESRASFLPDALAWLLSSRPRQSYGR
ncbi:acetoacetate decarboxylase family protein [Microvirga roseola]|uniref:acetoacetate decarboxylase family protein n=1 Tax=Microvirga roseola TaxID=2883126 RepID=UPI001E61D270|nr:acetoacetate decarboxylase family protein [Microvirga roseola]